MQPETFYRYEDTYLTDEFDFSSKYGDPRELTFSLVSEIPKGYWIGNLKVGPFLHYSYLSKPKWVSATSRKRFAYPTKKLALESYLMRKNRHISILKSQLERAEAGRSRAAILIEETN